MLENDITTLIVRGYQTINQVDPNAWDSLKNAKLAGIPTRHIYVYPCF